MNLAASCSPSLRASPGARRRDAARAFPRRPAGPDRQQPDLHHHDRAGADFHRGAGGVHGLPDVRKLQGALQAWLVQSLVPDNIARQVLGYLTQFSRQGQPAGRAGLTVLLVTPWRWCSPSTARSTASGACEGRGRWRSAC
jgi:hypothetical protein